MKIELDNIKHVHMVGIGGIGMSGLAKILLDRKVMVSGSDLKNNGLIENLIKMGCHISIGHGRIFRNPDMVVRSFSVRDNDPEIMEAKERGIPVIERMELLNAFFKSKPQSIAIAGTHGKTTTTAMISCIFDRGGLDPTVLIGGELGYFDGNAKSGRSDILISEIDESDGYLAGISPAYAIITNIEKDHMEYYKDMDNLLKAFECFIKNTKDIFFYNKEDSLLRKFAKGCKSRLITFGRHADCDFYPASISELGMSSEFICFNKKRKLGNIILNVPGRHNIMNALAAIACGLEFGLAFSRIKSILKDFRGVRRRFEIRSRINDIVLVDDYAHHPTEIKVVIKTARKINFKRIIAVFQPHRFSRTLYLEKEFSSAFTGVDELVLTDIYAAGENPIQGVSTKRIYDRIRKRNAGQRVKLMPKEVIAGYLGKIAKPKDLILVMGAGDINGIIPEIEKIIKR